MSASCLLALLSGTLAIHVEQTRNVDTATVAALVDLIGDAVQDRTNAPPTIDNLAWAVPCRGQSTCIDEIRRRTKGDDVLVLSFLGGPTRIRIIAERFTRGLEAVEFTLDIGRRVSRWPSELQSLLAALVPRQQRPKSLVVVEPLAPAPAFDPVPWIAMGVGAAALATGVGFGVSSRAAHRELEGGPVHGQRYLDARHRAATHATLANVLITTGVMGIAAGLITYVLN